MKVRNQAVKIQKRWLRTVLSLVLVLVTCGASGMPALAFFENGEGMLLSPGTGEKPSNTPYILGGIMVLCVVVIVLLFWPKRKDKKSEPTDNSDASNDQE